MALVIVIATVCMSYSFYTSHKVENNTFTTGKVQITLEEPEYSNEENSSKRKSIAPGEEITKDPVITNTGMSDCYVFMEVLNPVKSFTVVDSDGRKKTAEKTQQSFFKYEVNSYWVLVECRKDGTTVYAYAPRNDISVLKSSEKTLPFFKGEKIKAADFIEKETEEIEEIEMPVKAYAIQTTDLVKEDGTYVTDPLEIWELVKQSSLKYSNLFTSTRVSN